MQPIVDGRLLRWTTVDVMPGISIRILETEEEEDQLEIAIDDPDADPYAGILWPSSIAVATELAGHAGEGQTVVDLGAGTGLATLTAASVGAHAIALDHDPFSLNIIDAAASVQNLRVETRHFDIMGSEPLPDADILVISDLFYDPNLAIGAARRTIEAHNAGAHTFVADPGRAGSYAYTEKLKEAGIYVIFNPTEVTLPDGSMSVSVEITWIGPKTD